MCLNKFSLNECGEGRELFQFITVRINNENTMPKKVIGFLQRKRKKFREFGDLIKKIGS